MRVLVIAHGHPAFSIGGAEVAAHNLFAGLNAGDEAEAYFLARATAPLRRHADTPLLSLRQGAREVFLHSEAWQDFYLSNERPDEMAEGLARYVAQVRPDVVHFHHVIGLGMEALARVRAVLPSAPIVVTFHEYLAICHHHGQMVRTRRQALCRAASPADCATCFPQFTPGEFFQREMFIKDHLSLAAAYVAPSRFLIDRYVAWGLPAEKFTLIENGLVHADPAPPRAVGSATARNRFGYFGQLSAFKGLLVLLDAVARVPDSVWGDASLCIFGGNLDIQPEPFRARFDTLLAEAGRRVRFHGSYRAEELPRLMAQVDWTVVPSIWWENSPLVIQEAFLHRRPPIVSDIGGMAEKVRDGIDGLHFRAGSPEDLAEVFARALHEPGLWERLSSAAVPPPDLAHYAAAHLDLYRRLLPPARPVATAEARVPRAPLRPLRVKGIPHDQYTRDQPLGRDLRP
jgi:glycosyltransferase involved in cell wall biosynthesis